MTNSKRWFVILIGSALVILLLAGALVIYQTLAYGPGWMRGGFGYDNTGYYGRGMMGGYGPGSMMGFNNKGTFGYGPGWMRGGHGHGHMMGGYGSSRMMGWGMMGSVSPLVNAEPLSLAKATDAVNSYLVRLNDSSLELGEVMIFDNHAYAQIVEQDGGVGAMEVLVDPVTKAVYPEMGPNMMWNLKYGPMTGYDGAGMMGYFGYNNEASAQISAEMPVTPVKAVEAAQTYLSTYVGKDLEADEHADPFYGYYTLHINRDGQTIGMLSVNGYTGQVFLHTWHGNLIEMSESHEE